MIRAFRYRPTLVRYSHDLPAPVMLQLLPPARASWPGGSRTPAAPGPWELPELD